MIFFLKYYRYGNHRSADDNPKILKNVLVKHSKRGNTILLDPRLLPFIPHLHLTAQGLVDLMNKWKLPRPIFDRNKSTEGKVSFPGSFIRFCVWLWNMRITYPNLRIFIGDDDMTNAVCLVNQNPDAVSLHVFRGCGRFDVYTHQTFGDCYSPDNFDIISQARKQRAKYL